MTPASDSDIKITVNQLRNGRWAFVLVYRGVTHPAEGQFATQAEAQIAAHMAHRSLLSRR